MSRQGCEKSPPIVPHGVYLQKNAFITNIRGDFSLSSVSPLKYTPRCRFKNSKTRKISANCPKDFVTIVEVNCLICGMTTRQFQQQVVGALLYHGSRLLPLLFGLLWPEDDLSVLLPLGAKLCFCSLWSCMEYSA